MKVLISGAGIAGPTLAYWLERYGVEVTLVEKASALRTGGYVVDFWGAGFEIAGRMGLLPEIQRRGYSVREVRVVNDRGERVAGFSTDAFTRATGGGFTSVPRGDLAAAIFGTIAGRIDTIFGDHVTHIEQTDAQVHVTFAHHPTRSFDLVVGADGLHSHVRELTFGTEARFERYLGVKVAAFETTGYRPRDELVYLMYTEVGGQVCRFTMRDDRTMFLFTFSDRDPGGPVGVREQKACLRERFGRSGWECPQILDALDAADELYFDRVSRIEMPAAEGLWTKGRVVLLGDAAFCISLLGGQGSGLAMLAAYLLAGELHRANGNVAEAAARYQERFAAFALTKQRAARGFAGGFAPKTKLGIFLRNQLFNLLAVHWVATLTAGRGFSDKIEIPEY